MRYPSIAAVLFALTGFVQAQEASQPWTHPEVLRAAIVIGLSEDQRPLFRGAVSEFLQGFGADVQRLLRANNQTNLPRKIASKRRIRAKAMDEQMQELLSEEQFTAYESYRDKLLEQMDKRAAARRR